MSVSTSPMPRMRLAMRSGWNGSNSSSFSPVPANRIGLPTTSFTERAAPPRASPSIFVRITPSRPIARSKASATLTASWPVIASTTSSVSCGPTLSRTRRSSPMSASSICNRPAVSRTTTLRPVRSASLSAPRATFTGSVDSENRGTSMRSPRTRSCSTAAGRWRSAPTSSGLRPSATRWRASLPAAVVFPEPCRPTSITTVGGFELIASLPVSPPSVVTSSSWTILMTCCAGLRLFATSAPRARSLTRLMNDFTTVTFTSASSSATRISLASSSMSLSLSGPRPRRRSNMRSYRSARQSNTRTTVCGQLGGEVLGVEGGEVLGRLAHADQLHRHAEVGLDREDDAALGRAVQLRQHDAGHVDGVGELARLRQAVLAGGGVDDEEDLLERARSPLRDAPDLLELLHQVDFGVHAAGGVDQDDTRAASARGVDGVEDDGARVGSLLAAHDVGPDAVGPVGELVGGGGPKRVGGRHERGVTVVDLAPGELGDGRGLPCPVHADEQPHRRPADGVVQGSVAPGEVVDDLRPQQRDELLRIVDPLGGGAGTELVDEAGRRRHADVGDQQGLLDAVPRLVVDRAPTGQRAEPPGERRAPPAQAVAQAGRGSRRWRRTRGRRDRGRRPVPVGPRRRRRLLEPLRAARQPEAEPDERGGQHEDADDEDGGERRRHGGLFGSGAGGAYRPPSAPPDGRSSAAGGGGSPRR